MPNTALITGASSGIGMEFARYHAAKGGDVILTARRTETLETLKSELETKHNITAHVFAADLALEGAALQVYTEITAAGLQVDILINNAGFGGIGIHTDLPLDQELGMIDLNIKALVTLTHEFGRDMAIRGKGKILQVGSTAGFMPGPRQATYFATKAFVRSFSQAIDHELRPRGVTCTLLAPGYVETEFAKRADMIGTKLAQNGATAASVAQNGYDAMMAGKLVTINETMLGFAVNWIIPLLPTRMGMAITAKLQAK